MEKENSPLEWKTEKRKIDALIGHQKNPRKISDGQMEQLKKSINKFNLVEIPAIDLDNTILAGHQRLKAMQTVGRGSEEIDVRVPNRKLTEKERDEYLIRSNKNTGEWDEDLLAEFDEDLLKSIGFEELELDRIYNQGTEDDYDVEKKVKEIKEKGKTISQLGDVWELGKHKVIVGDSTDEKVYEKLLCDEKATCCFTSPPYNMNSEMYSEYTDNKESQEYILFNIKVFELVKKYLKGFVFWNISYNKNSRWEFIDIMHQLIHQTNMKFLELIVWNKKHAIPITSREMLTRQYEDILLLGDENSVSQDLDLYYLGGVLDGRAYFNKRTNQAITNYWEVKTQGSQIDGHLACFPVGLPQKGILLTTKRGEIVLDPFGGSGSTLIACENTGRVARLIELSPIYTDIIIDRWEKLTGQKAKKL